MEASTEIARLREELEKLVLLEEVAERRQLLIEKRLAAAVAAGASPEQLREELDLSAESFDKLVSLDAPPVAERLGVSEESAENLSEHPSA
jgi:hypothetical protein